MRVSVISKFLLLAVATGWAASGAAQTSSCPDQWPVATVHTIGKGQAPSENPKLSHAITGHIVDPTSVGYTDDRIRVCSGTSVRAVVTDATGTPTNTASTPGITCTDAGCSAEAITETQEYVSRSSDGGDTDRVTLIPE